MQIVQKEPQKNYETKIPDMFRISKKKKNPVHMRRMCKPPYKILKMQLKTVIGDCREKHVSLSARTAGRRTRIR